MAESVRLLFFGEVIDGYAPDEVKRLLGQLFKLDEAGVARLFSGARVVLNEAVDVDAAAQHVTRFARLGARVRIEAPASLPTALRAATAEDEQALKARRGDAAGTGFWGLGFDGRVGRLTYASASAFMLAVMLAGLAMVLRQPNLVRMAAFALGVLAVLFVSLRLTVLRCHDCNRNGWWSLLVLVPYLGALVTLLLSLMPGSAQANDHGEPPAPAHGLLAGGALVLLVASMATAGPSVLAVVMLHGEAPQTLAQDDAKDTPALALLPREALTVYRTEYLSAKEHKAFAVSAGGAWGWKAGAALADEAVAAALAACSARRQRHTPDCVPVNVDSEWLPSSP